MNEKKKIFISWSGRLSETVADIFKKWIPNVLQDIEPFFSTEDIRKGRRPIETIFDNMKDARFAISCLTMSNKEKPWIEFEAGFLSGLNVPVAGFLVNLSVDDLKLPLSNFQHTINDKEDVKRLLNAIRETCDSITTVDQFNNSFEREWPVFSENLTKILANESLNLEERSKTNVISEEQIREIIDNRIEEVLKDYPKQKVLTQKEYDALEHVDKDTLYLIV